MDGSQWFGRNINSYTWFWGVFCLRNGEAITKVGEEGIYSIGAERAHIRWATPQEDLEMCIPKFFSKK
jgi:hypothetical protein